jgi:hypothetical protein
MGVVGGEAPPPPAEEPEDEPGPDPDPAPGITGAGAPVHGSTDVPAEPAPLDEVFGAEGFKAERRLCLRWDGQWRCFVRWQARALWDERCLGAASAAAASVPMQAQSTQSRSADLPARNIT